MKNISKLTKEQIESFIMGVVCTFELGDTIDERKEVKWTVSHVDVKVHIKVEWIKSVKHYKAINPIIDKDSDYCFDDYYFSVGSNESPRKLCKEIIDAIEYININEFNEYL